MAARHLKGAIIGIDSANPVASVVLFQYNSDTLTRNIQAQMVERGGNLPSEPMRFKGAPTEDIKLEVEIDAADQLDRSDPVSVSMGIAPQLAALEMLVYPKSKLVLANSELLAAGGLEIIAPEAPLTLFVWGPQRVIPVRLSSLDITEQAYDERLNPIQAKVSLSLRVLSYNDFPRDHLGYSLFIAHQVLKEAMAVIGSVGGTASATGASLPG